MSEALVWHLIRDNNAFLVKRGRANRTGAVQFSKEPGNVMNVNTFKYSGIANNKTVHVAAAKDGKMSVATKNANLNKPAQSTTAQSLKLNLKHATAAIDGLKYRSDLAAAAKIRYSKLYRGVRVERGVIKGSRVGPSRK